MDKAELVEFLKENLRVVTEESRHSDGYIVVKILLGEEVITSDSVRVDY